jgi:hypothetical protein
MNKKPKNVDSKSAPECSLPLKLTIPYRPCHTDKIEPYVQKVALELARDGMFGGLLGHEFKVYVRVHRNPKRIVYSFRTSGDDSIDEVERESTRLR